MGCAIVIKGIQVLHRRHSLNYLFLFIRTVRSPFPIQSVSAIYASHLYFTLSMPKSSFLSSIADKAQSAMNSSPLAGHIPGYQQSSNTDPASQPSANDAAGQKSFAFESIQHQFRSIQQQYTYGLS